MPHHSSKFPLMLVLILLLSSLSWTAQAQTVPPPRDLWLWNYTTILTPEGRDEVLQFARDQHIRTIYLESQALLQNQSATLGTFIAQARAAGVQVELLFGNPRWALAPYHQEAVSLAQQAVTFSQSLGSSGPIGLHFDVEPYLLAEWQQDRNATANQYLDLLAKLQAEVQGSSLTLTVDIPFWYDTIPVTRNGITRNMHMWVLDTVDRITIMAYRDHAQPPDGIIDHVQNEITYATDVGKRVVIGVETNCGLFPEKITFCEEGLTAMENAFQSVRAVYAASPAFDNFAVHDYRGYQALVSASLTSTSTATLFPTTWMLPNFMPLTPTGRLNDTANP